MTSSRRRGCTHPVRLRVMQYSRLAAAFGVLGVEVDKHQWQAQKRQTSPEEVDKKVRIPAGYFGRIQAVKVPHSDSNSEREYDNFTAKNPPTLLRGENKFQNVKLKKPLKW